LFFGYPVNDASSLGKSYPDIVVSIANKISDARDFIMFKTICKGWKYARSSEAHPFDRWILKSEFIGESRAVTFTSVVDIRLLRSRFLH
jgi:hypothetical protein